MTTASRTHAVVLTEMGCGNGGGGPGGRRSRPASWAVARPGWPACASGPTGPGAAEVRSALSLIAHAASPRQTPHSPPPRSVLAGAATCSHHVPLRLIRPCCVVAHQARMIASTAEDGRETWLACG